MSDIKVLVVEDEQLIAFEIESALESLGFIVDGAKNSDEAIKSVNDFKPNIILMDINLEHSKKDGIDTVKEVKQIIPDMPIIYLTAFSDDKTFDRAIETEPKAYLIKPFKREELKTNIKIALNNNTAKNKQIEDKSIKYLDENLYFNTKEEQLYKNDVPIKLSKNEKALLTLLLGARGHIVSLQNIESHVWSDKVVADSTVRSLIHRLRCKTDPKLIKNHLGIGCQLVCN